MKKYTFEVVIQEGSDEFWEDATANNKSGVDVLLETITNHINEQGWDAKVKLVKFEDK
jgi:hypothetical protein